MHNSLQSGRHLADLKTAYQVVPFPLAELQSRVISLLWAKLLPSFPTHPELPPNPSNPYWTPPDTPPTSSPSPQPSSAVNGSNEIAHSAASPPTAPVRQVLSTRQKLVFGASYEWVYCEYLMSLMQEADREEKTEDYWRVIEGFRKERRADSTLRKRTLGY